MEHLKALCSVLGLSLDEATGAAPLEAKTAIEHRMLSILRGMDAGNAEVLLMTGEALARAGRPK